VFPGDRPDEKTVSEVVRDLKERFGIRRAVFVGDRGMLSEENLAAILDADFDCLMSLLEPTFEGLTVRADEEPRRFENLVDGKLIVETSCGELGAEELILRYKELGDIEQAFRTLKASLKIRPVYHWTQRRIRAHVFLCVLALQFHRFMRGELARSNLSVERSLERLKTVKAGTLRLQAQRVPYVTALTETHKELYEQLELPFPRVKDVSLSVLNYSDNSRSAWANPLVCRFFRLSTVRVRGALCENRANFLHCNDPGASGNEVIAGIFYGEIGD